MHRIAYYRTSSREGQSIESQRTAMGGNFDREFLDEGIGGATMAASRPGLGPLLAHGLRPGDTLYVYAVDRLGRDAIDVQTTVRDVIKRGASVHVHGLGVIGPGVGELILAVLAQVAQMERTRIKERTEAGRVTAREHLAKHGKTQHGALGMGRPVAVDAAALLKWKARTGSSIAVTAKHWKVSETTVKRYARAA